MTKAQQHRKAIRAERHRAHQTVHQCFVIAKKLHDNGSHLATDTQLLTEQEKIL